tara:strand:- start:547 stop:1668 length:1122 start_codon:yes stop_codon:yes gene_type:complete
MIIKDKSLDVLFYYPQHFNRNADGSNPYITSLIKVCENNNISYRFVEETDKKSGKPSNPKACKFDRWLFLILVLRKLLPMALFSCFEYREQFIGRIIRYLSFGKFKASVIVTLSNSMGGVLRGINPTARIFDYQHGIIDSKQPGFFKTRKAPNWIRSNNKEVLVYGKGFKDIMINTDKEYYQNKTHCIGAPNTLSSNFIKGNNILVSLQIIELENVSLEWLSAQVEMLDDIFKNDSTTSQLSNRMVYLRHHPRSNRSFDLQKLYAFPFVKDFDDSIESTQIGLHITFFSTSAFEFASLGIPTLFLFNRIIPQGETLFYNEFNYPYQNWNSINEWITALSQEDSFKISRNIKNWYKLFYQPFNEQKFLELITCK